MTEREPRWDFDWERGRQGELFVQDVMAAIQAKTPVEVKRDDRTADTGRIYVEYECKGRPSGIQTSQSPLWAFVLGGNAVLFIPIDALKQLARQAWQYPRNRVECTRGSHPTKGVTIPLADVAAWLTNGKP